MGKRVSWLAIPLGALLCAAVGVAWVRHQALALPAWYEEDAEVLPESADETAEPTVTPRGWIAVPDAVDSDRAPARARPARRQVHRELRNFHVQAVAKEPAFRRAIKGSRAVYRNGKLEIGAVIDIDRIPNDKLSAEGTRILRRIERVFPGLKGKAVYVGLEDEPVTRDGILQLGGDPQVKVGKLGMSLDQLARRVGLPPRQVRRDLDRLFRQLGVTAPSSSEASSG